MPASSNNLATALRLPFDAFVNAPSVIYHGSIGLIGLIWASGYYILPYAASVSGFYTLFPVLSILLFSDGAFDDNGMVGVGVATLAWILQIFLLVDLMPHQADDPFPVLAEMYPMPFPWRVLSTWLLLAGAGSVLMFGVALLMRSVETTESKKLGLARQRQ